MERKARIVKGIITPVPKKVSEKRDVKPNCKTGSSDDGISEPSPLVVKDTSAKDKVEEKGNNEPWLSSAKRSDLIGEVNTESHQKVPEETGSRPRVTARRKLPISPVEMSRKRTPINSKVTEKSEEDTKQFFNPFESFRALLRTDWKKNKNKLDFRKYVKKFADDNAANSGISVATTKTTATNTITNTDYVTSAITITTTTTNTTNVSTTATSSTGSPEIVKMESDVCKKISEILSKLEGYKNRVDRFEPSSNKRHFTNLERCLLLCRAELDDLEVSECHYQYRKMAYKAVHDTLSELYSKN